MVGLDGAAQSGHDDGAVGRAGADPAGACRREPGNEIQSPMATVVLGGLLTAVLLNLVVVPALFLRFGAETRDAGSPDAHDAQATLALEAR